MSNIELSAEAEALWEDAGEMLDFFEISEEELAGLSEEGLRALRKRVRRQRLANIATLLEQSEHLVPALYDEIARRRERYVRNLSNQLVKDGRPADQRALDFQRGIWYGAVLALVALPREAKKSLEAQRVDDTEGVDAS